MDTQVERIDHINIVVKDLSKVKDFFLTPGFVQEDQSSPIPRERQTLLFRARRVSFAQTMARERTAGAIDGAAQATRSFVNPAGDGRISSFSFPAGPENHPISR